MKTRLGDGTGSKNPRRRSKMHPNIEEHLVSKSPFETFGVSNSTFKRAEFPPFGLWPNALWVTIRHTFFDLFAKD